MYNLLQTVEEEKTFPNSFYEGGITLRPKRGEGIMRKEKYRPISIRNTDVKFFNTLLANPIQQ